eukprot:9246223-Pyramimonas_sp.AAC.1
MARRGPPKLPLALKDPSVHPGCLPGFTTCIPSYTLPSALMGRVFEWAGGDTRSVHIDNIVLPVKVRVDVKAIY